MKSFVCALVATAVLWGQTAPKDAIFQAMDAELERARTLKLETLDKPYYIEYGVDEHEGYTIAASLGALYAPSNITFRVPRVRVRVGSNEFDNTNYVFSDYYSGSRYDPDQLTLDNDIGVLRRAFWLASDRAFKGAVEAIARKRAALRNVTQQEALPDFWKAPPVVKVLPPASALPDHADWPNRVKRLSSVFGTYPDVTTSSVTLETNRTTYYFRNSEGTTLRIPDTMTQVIVRASGQAADGMGVRDGIHIARLDLKSMPSDVDVLEQTKRVAENVKALSAAPLGENYNGPVMFEGLAAAQVFAEVLGPNLSLPRRPVNEPSRGAPFLPSELEGRTGSRVLPDFLDIVDDPLQSSWNGTQLLGHYEVDEEGVVPTPLTLIEKGRLKTYLLTRQPVKGYEGSNGRARIPGPYGASQAMISNLFVNSSETVKPAELRAKMIQMLKDRTKPYGIIVRKMDFPSNTPVDELRKLVQASSQRGVARPISPPALVYKVFPDGHEELVRGLRFRGLSVRSFRDILAVSDEKNAFHYLNTSSPFGLGGGYVAPTSVVAPSFLIEELELERPQDEMPKLPVVPAPPLTAAPSR